MRVLCVIVISLSAMASNLLADVFTYTGALQTYTVATSGYYYIRANGAAGGNGGQAGGRRARANGTYYLDAGTVLSIVVGGAGAKPDKQWWRWRGR